VRRPRRGAPAPPSRDPEPRRTAPWPGASAPNSESPDLTTVTRGRLRPRLKAPPLTTGEPSYRCSQRRASQPNRNLRRDTAAVRSPAGSSEQRSGTRVPFLASLARVSQPATFAAYRAALTAPGAQAPAIAAALGRLPIAMIGLALLFYVQRSTGSFAIAGAVTAATLAGVAAGSVVQGRLVDRMGPTRPLLVYSLLFATLVAVEIAAIEAGASPGLLVAAALGVGAAQPVIASASRGLWTQLVPAGPVRSAAYAYEAISLEVFFILGPGLAGLLAAGPWWPGTGTVAGAATMLAGTVAFTLTPAVRAWRGDRDGREGRGLLGAIRVPGMQTLVIAAFGFGVTVGVVEVAVPAAATLAGRPGLGGLLISLWSVSSVAIGLLYGVRPWPRATHQRPAALLLGFSLLLSLPAAAGGGLVQLAVALFMAGALITPQVTTYSIVIEAVAPHGSVAEAFGWMVTAVTLGLAAGQSASGSIVELAGPPAAFLAAAGAGVALAAAVWLRRDTLRPRAELDRLEPRTALTGVCGC
jgi:Major Facilitator Superfamily